MTRPLVHHLARLSRSLDREGIAHDLVTSLAAGVPAIEVPLSNDDDDDVAYLMVDDAGAFSGAFSGACAHRAPECFTDDVDALVAFVQEVRHA